MPTALQLPKIVFGTSGLGNLFEAVDYSIKLEIVKEIFAHTKGPVMFDTAGKYGAGLALETLGKCLKELSINPADVLISNKLGWLRTTLKTAEPTFEPGVWKGLGHDAVQRISYDSILACYQQGNELLNGYPAQLVSVHDPDEYLATAKNDMEEKKLYNNILEAYKALYWLKQQGKVKAIGVGAKNWKSIERITKDIKLDWVMIANSMTIKNHPAGLVAFMKSLQDDGIAIINSAVFNAGFLIGGKYFDYKLIEPDTVMNKAIFKWREDFFVVCNNFNITPAQACTQFGLKAPGVVSIALNTTNPKRVKENTAMAGVQIPATFWDAMKAKGLIRADYCI
jgi:D-threo-aldose 1-dehydrogenase